MSRYLSNEATAEELTVFLQLLKQGRLDETFNRIVDEEISSDADDTNEAD
ncbi:hypothetical protein ACFP1I_15455 [Dyadobacter subterraneus]|uniref:Uncharacterized protein n=1 Tax=Dyadobacter subterraneus TaxID=2773304 RepID=A0ABR9WBH5_9BACT|nr:hypothetical protein [Dyadobacter subterraneus]MBE9462839.1 hypothetical protein [Dyadobacter subterraneus]